jgi:hypothetical protein
VDDEETYAFDADGFNFVRSDASKLASSKVRFGKS